MWLHPYNTKWRENETNYKPTVTAAFTSTAVDTGTQVFLGQIWDRSLPERGQRLRISEHTSKPHLTHTHRLNEQKHSRLPTLRSPTQPVGAEESDNFKQFLLTHHHFRSSFSKELFRPPTSHSFWVPTTCQLSMQTRTVCGCHQSPLWLPLFRSPLIYTCVKRPVVKIEALHGKSRFPLSSHHGSGGSR